MSGEARWVVREGQVRRCGSYWSNGPNQQWWVHATAMKMDREKAERLAKALGGRIVRLVSRAEAIARAERKARREALEDAAAMLDRCAQSQDHAAWEAAQAGLSALVAKHETVAGSYRLSAKSIREMVAW